MISEVDICNLALTKLGDNTISALTDATENARKCKIVYEPTRDSVLRSHSWSFATKIEPLSLIADEEIINWDYLYVYPSQCLYLVRIFDENGADDNNYKKLLSPDTNTPCLATNISQAYIEYIKKITDTNLFDSLFVDALVLKIAAELAIPITGDANLANKFLQEYTYIISEAKKRDAQEKNSKIISKSPYREAR